MGRCKKDWQEDKRKDQHTVAYSAFTESWAPTKLENATRPKAKKNDILKRMLTREVLSPKTTNKTNEQSIYPNSFGPLVAVDHNPTEAWPCRASCYIGIREGPICGGTQKPDTKLMQYPSAMHEL